MFVCITPLLAVPDPVDSTGKTPLCIACFEGLAKVASALLHGGAHVDFVTPPRHMNAGMTPLMYAVTGNHAGVVKLLLKRGADGAKTTTLAVHGHDAASTALDIARLHADSDHDYAETLEVLHRRCCSTCGMTSPGLCAMTAGEEQHLKRCGDCPARGPRARYCSKECQRADWVPRHRGECAEARRVWLTAGADV